MRAIVVAPIAFLLASCVDTCPGPSLGITTWTFEIVSAEVICVGRMDVTFSPPQDDSYAADIAGAWTCDNNTAKLSGTLDGRTQRDTDITNLNFLGDKTFSATGIFARVAFFARAGIGPTGGSLSGFRN